MTDEAINKAIAEFDGYKFVVFNKGWKGWIFARNSEVQVNIPDYCNDLNAMAKAEDLLSNEQLQTYFSVLRPLVESTAKPGRGYVFTAKASQRAKAFVITIEKWEK
jgi:hypothetical protein